MATNHLWFSCLHRALFLKFSSLEDIHVVTKCWVTSDVELCTYACLRWGISVQRNLWLLPILRPCGWLHSLPVCVCVCMCITTVSTHCGWEGRDAYCVHLGVCTWVHYWAHYIYPYTSMLRSLNTSCFNTTLLFHSVLPPNKSILQTSSYCCVVSLQISAHTTMAVSGLPVIDELSKDISGIVANNCRRAFAGYLWG